MPRFIPFLVLALAIVGTRVPKPVEPIRGDGRWFVDATREHLELRYGSCDDGDWDDWILVALVGKLRTRARTHLAPRCCAQGVAAGPTLCTPTCRWCIATQRPSPGVPTMSA